MDIGDRFVTLRAKVDVHQEAAVLNLENVLNAGVKQCTATYVKHHAIIIVSTIRVSGMANVR